MLGVKKKKKNMNEEHQLDQKRKVSDSRKELRVIEELISRSAVWTPENRSQEAHHSSGFRCLFPLLEMRKNGQSSKYLQMEKWGAFDKRLQIKKTIIHQFMNKIELIETYPFKLFLNAWWRQDYLAIGSSVGAGNLSEWPKIKHAHADITEEKQKEKEN